MTGSGDTNPTRDVIDRAKAALEGETVAEFFTACRSLVPELVDEIQRLRHVASIPIPIQVDCRCRCETCIGSDCVGHVCAPHAPGRWLIEGPHMAHPLPDDFDTEDAAEAFIRALGFQWLSVRVQP